MKEMPSGLKDEEKILTEILDDMRIFEPDTPLLKAKSFSRMPSITEIFNNDLPI